MAETSQKKSLGVFHLLPELEHGGVEDHVVALANAQARMGLRVFVVSGGGRLTSYLDARVRHFTLAVGRKNLFAGIVCARKIASLARIHDVKIIHAHSRVPGWVAWFARIFNSRLKFIYTVHALFSKNFGTWPIGRADAVICVSNAVRDDLRYRLDKVGDVRVIYNALTKQVVPWRGSGGATKRIAYSGRLTGLKNLSAVISALAATAGSDWVFDVCGDGPKLDELKAQAADLGLSSKVIFCGYVSDISEKIAACDLFVFPSRQEGMPLALIESLSASVPSIASDIPADREITAGDELIPPDDVDAWTDAIKKFLSGEKIPSLRLGVELPTIEALAERVAEVYHDAAA